MKLPQNTLAPAERTPEAKPVSVSRRIVPLFCFMILLAPPALYLVAANHFAAARGPLWQGLYDPSYVYLLNSLLLIDGETPVHVDHPGTPVQLIGAGLLATKNALFDKRQDLAKAVIKKPEKYLEFLSSSLRYLFAISLLLAPIWIWIRTNSFSTAVAFQVAPLLNQMAFIEGGGYFKPESLINTLILWFCAWVVTDLIRQSRQRADPSWTLEEILAALSAGACIATKMHTAPIFLIALIVASSLRKALLLGAAVTLVFVLSCTLPIFSALAQTADFAFQVASHTQKYGDGKLGIVDPELFWRALGGLFSRNWITFGFVGLFALYHAVRLTLRSNHASIRLDLAGLFLAGIQLGFLLLVAKHPADHYLLPVVVSLSLSTALVVYTLDGMRNYWGWGCRFRSSLRGGALPFPSQSGVDGRGRESRGRRENVVLRTNSL